MISISTIDMGCFGSKGIFILRNFEMSFFRCPITMELPTPLNNSEYFLAYTYVVARISYSLTNVLMTPATEAATKHESLPKSIPITGIVDFIVGHFNCSENSEMYTTSMIDVIRIRILRCCECPALLLKFTQMILFMRKCKLRFRKIAVITTEQNEIQILLLPLQCTQGE